MEDNDSDGKAELDRDEEVPSWAREMIQSHRDLMDSNATLTRTVQRLARQVEQLTGAVARLMGYQMGEVSDHSSDRE